MLCGVRSVVFAAAGAALSAMSQNGGGMNPYASGGVNQYGASGGGSGGGAVNPYGAARHGDEPFTPYSSSGGGGGGAPALPAPGGASAAKAPASEPEVGPPCLSVAILRWNR